LSSRVGRNACAGSSFAPNVIHVALEKLLDGYQSVELEQNRQPRLWGWIFRGFAEATRQIDAQGFDPAGKGSGRQR
jgi:hypothetical protein